MITLADRLCFDLTEQWLRSQRIPIIVAGNDWSMQVRYRLNGTPVALTDAVITWCWRASPGGTALLTKISTDTDEIEIDPDQVTNTGLARFKISAGDEATLLAMGGRVLHHDARILWPDTTYGLWFAGDVQARVPNVRNSQFTPDP